MSQISLTASMRSNLLSLQGTSQLMSQTQERLSTGKKVNSAIDNASAYYTAQSLSNRASDLSGLLDSMGQAISTIKAANEGIESVTSFVEQAKAVATSAADTTDSESRASYAKQFNSIIEQLDKLAADSGYKGINLLQGDKLTVIFNEARDNKLDIQGVKVTASEFGLAEQDWNIDGDPTVKKAHDAIEPKQTAYNTAAAKGTSADKLVDEAVIIIEVESVETPALKKGVALKKGDLISDGTNYWRATADIAAQEADTAVPGSLALEAVTQSTNDKLYYIAADKTAADTAFTALKNAKTAYETAYKARVETVNTAINTTIESATKAINTLRSHASDFGTNYSIVQNRQSFTENLINVLEEGADNLVLADMNEESANMLALQTRQQLAINSLSLASQASQSVLRLFS